MKRYLLTASLLALSGLGLLAPRASADTSTKTYQVPMTAIAANFCLLDAGVVVPGTLKVSGDGDRLETLTPGSVTYVCNEPTEASVNTPTQNTAFQDTTGTLNVTTAAARIVGVTNVGAGVSYRRSQFDD